MTLLENLVPDEEEAPIFQMPDKSLTPLDEESTADDAHLLIITMLTCIAVEEHKQALLKMLYCLGVYPGINTNMLQLSLGATYRAAIWRPLLTILEQLGVVYTKTLTVRAPTGRYQKHNKLSLHSAAYEYMCGFHNK